MPDLFEGLTLGQVRRELGHMVALADTAEHPKPTLINPPGHPMPGHEWIIDQRVIDRRATAPTWWVRTVDNAEGVDAVYVSSPDSMAPGDDFISMLPEDARRLAMAILAAADRAEHLGAGVPRLEDRRTNA